MIHVVNKGKTGEREVVDLLATEIYYLMHQNQYDDETRAKLYSLVQRNQNQSAEGGGDINVLGLSVEVKRCETLEVEKWWRQACTSAARNEDAPVLIYRQNRKQWHVVMMGWLALPQGNHIQSRVTISMEEFKVFFASWAAYKIERGDLNRI